MRIMNAHSKWFWLFVCTIAAIWSRPGLCDTIAPAQTRVSASPDGSCYVKFVPESETLDATAGIAIIFEVSRDSCDREIWRVELPVRSSLHMTNSGEYLVVTNIQPELHNGYVIECYRFGQRVWGHSLEAVAKNPEGVPRSITGLVLWKSPDKAPWFHGKRFVVITRENLRHYVDLENGNISRTVHHQWPPN